MYIHCRYRFIERFPMRTVVQKWGHSLALRIPKTMAEHIKVREGAPVEIREDRGSLLIKPTLAKPSLRALLAKIKPENLHQETKTGRPVGKEVW
jgi:antitoxin MazE